MVSVPGAAASRRVGTLWSVVAALWIIAIGGYLILTTAHRTAARQGIAVPAGPYALDSRIREAGRLIWLTPQQLTALRVQFDDPWPASEASIGIYLDGAQTIIIRPDYADVPPIQLSSVIGYEYLHYVWTHRSHPEALKAWMNQAVDTDPALKDALAAVVALDGDASLRWTELLSLTCTKTQDVHLPAQLVAYCDQELPGRRNLAPANFVY